MVGIVDIAAEAPKDAIKLQRTDSGGSSVPNPDRG